MRCVVTGAAGFIGSHLCEYLLKKGHDVCGIDALIPYYAPECKERNLAEAKEHQRFRFAHSDLRHEPIDELVEWADVVYHLAGMHRHFPAAEFNELAAEFLVRGEECGAL